MKKRNAIAIFEANLRNPISTIISLITGSCWTHAAVCVEGIWYDSSESRGSFDKLDINEYSDRWCIVVDIDMDLSLWLNHMKGKKYNWKGILQFPFTFMFKRDKSQFYCFQTAWDALWYSLYEEHFTPNRVSGDSLKYFIMEMTNSSFKYQKGIK